MTERVRCYLHYYIKIKFLLFIMIILMLFFKKEAGKACTTEMFLVISLNSINGPTYLKNIHAVSLTHVHFGS